MQDDHHCFVFRAESAAEAASDALATLVSDYELRCDATLTDGPTRIR